MIGLKKFRIFYVLKSGSISGLKGKPVQSLSSITPLIDEVIDDYYIGIYRVVGGVNSRSLITWNTLKNCINIEISFGDDGTFKNVEKAQLIELLSDYEIVLSKPDEYGFTEDQAPWPLDEEP